ncbi:MAG: Anaerobic nitric oxide reductase transcription regulator NorR [Verrucomicrobiae bacterium]|nr:Anaerobic nitric oxide reductase transcription regulator NorR [Verrucomicrobiae bacterium]
MADGKSLPIAGLSEDVALRRIVEGTVTETGEKFFAALTKNLAEVLGTYGAWVTEFVPETRRLRILSFWIKDHWQEPFDYDITGTPCETCIEEMRWVHVPDNILQLYPGDTDSRFGQAASYLGLALRDTDQAILGHLAVLDDKPMPANPRALALFEIFASRAAAEFRRLRAEKAVREREEKLRRLITSAMDAIIELDAGLRVTLFNPAAEKVFAPAAGQDFGQFLAPDSRRKLKALVRELDARPAGQQFMWIPGGLETRGFPAEASLARSEQNRQAFYTLVLRNVNDRLEAERKIHSLTAEAEYLREEIRTLEQFDEIIGHSEPLLRVLKDIQQVAVTDATVLILGETGTGKELIARAIHAGSPRRDRPLIKVNCSAIPATLMESEFFGHEKGAFTGATGKRDGRFALADSGTIFLDEIGDLSLDLQAKLLRVLQEGEFEPVGSSRTHKVNVRVVAATNRDLGKAVHEGQFRQDLYYRLNVFPISLPALRERGDDVVLLAEAFVKRFAKRHGQNVTGLAADDRRRLRAYDWPGNVRELQNVIERAVITARDGRLNLDRALPENSPVASPAPPAGAILTAVELAQLERQNIQRALTAAAWRVAGKDGAAARLGMKPSTLTSRMKALKIQKQ